MRKILYLFAFLLTCSMTSNAQLKVVATGDVGIGTSTPTSKLDVLGDLTLSHVSGNSTKIRNSSSNLFIEKTKATGTVLIDISPLPMDGTSNASFRFFRTTNTTGNAKFDVHFGNNTSAVNASFSGNNNSFVAKNNGNLGVGTGAPTAKLHVDGDIVYSGTIMDISDRRLKKNINKFDGGLNEVMNMNVVSFEYTGESVTRNAKGQKIGVIAQELQEVAPYLVQEFTQFDTDLEGNLTTSNDYLRIKDSEIKYLLINSIQAQQEIIEDLQGQIEELRELVKAGQVGTTSHEVNAEIAGQTATEEAMLAQNTPNPFTEETVITYNVPKDATSASIQIFSNTGQLLKTVNIDQRGAGQLNLRANSLPSGSYMYNLVIDGSTIATKSMVLTK